MAYKLINTQIIPDMPIIFSNLAINDLLIAKNKMIIKIIIGNKTFSIVYIFDIVLGFIVIYY